MDGTFAEALVAFLEKWEEAKEQEGIHAKFYLEDAPEKLNEAFDKFVADAVRKRMDGGA